MSFWLKAFLLTQLFEMPIYVMALGHNRRWWKRLLIAFGASAITHPIVWWGNWQWLGHEAWLVLAVKESFAVLVEAGYLRLLGLRYALLWALAANATSFFLGLALFELVQLLRSALG